MAGQKQPIALLEIKGKKHLVKKEIEERKATEICAPADNISAPEYLNKKQKAEFNKIAFQLIDLEIMSNLDCDALARFIIARSNYIKFTKIVNDIPADWEMVNALDKATSIQDKAFKQCRSAAADLGLTISSRCKLSVPKKEEAPPSKWDNYKAGGASG